ncbi:MAG TPA: DUF1801 domain-containing protein [Bacteroidota bacterium]|nr:DUF1801 domain-containing protein [Bacteroidota bacterium]
MGRPAKDVDAYIAAAPANARKALRALRNTVKAAAQEADEVISYGMPAYKYRGQLVYFAAFVDHCSFFPGSKRILKTFSRELKPFDASAGTIRFTPEKPLPAALVKKIVRLRMRENEERAKGRETRTR